MKAKDKVIVVTGAGGGIGRELVLHLLEKGATVAAVDINKQLLNETVEKAGKNKSRVSSHVLDITDRKKVAALPAKVIAAHGTVDGIINNAGIIQPFIKINDLKFEAIERVMNVNFYGCLNMTKAFLPHFLKLDEAHVVNISSMGGFFPFPGQSIYGAAKAAIKIMTEGLYAELIETNVHVTIVFPGAVNTKISENSGLGKMESNEKFIGTQPRQAAEMIVKGMEQNAFQVFAGSDSKFMHFLYKLSPERAIAFIYKKMKHHLQG